MLKRIFLFFLWPSIWFFLSVFLKPGLGSEWCFLVFSVSLFWIIACGAKGCLYAIFFWGIMLDVYKSNVVGIHLSGLLCLFWLVKTIRSKLVWSYYLTQIIYIFGTFLFFYLWRYMIYNLLDITEEIPHFIPALLGALKGSVIASLVYKIYVIYDN